MDLFLHEYTIEHEPLAARMRPETLDEFFGQKHILAKGKLLRRAIEADRISSLIFYGPPGCGKTTLARVICNLTHADFVQINAVQNNVADLRRIIEQAKKMFASQKRKTLLVVDEIHRFNKAQQDVLMPDVERGNPILIGTTTENPFFSVNAALLSRSQIFEFKQLTEEDIIDVIKQALENKKKGLGELDIEVTSDAIEHIARRSDGDARKALSALEIGALTTTKDEKGTVIFDLKTAEESIQKKAVLYDKKGDGHYDTASAFIKSMRGSDPDAALYWLAKMIVAGEDPMFIARRIVICASEDVGNADPQALVIANAAMDASHKIGFPEARIILAQAVVYIACAPKSNAVYLAIDKAISDVENAPLQEIPDHLKDTHYASAAKLGRGKGYKYSHDHEDHYVEQEYMRKKEKYYEPTNMGYESKIKAWLSMLDKKRN